MESSTEVKKTSAPVNRTVIIVAVLVLLAAVSVSAFALLGGGKEDDGPKIAYASEARVMLDQDELSAAMQEAVENSKKGMISLKYKNNAYSTDGVNFECSITNSASNLYDMYLTIFADAELTDQIYLSGLVPPGSGFDHITLDRALETGDHTVYVALTQVETDEETGKQTLIRQVMHTMDFHVTEE